VLRDLLEEIRKEEKVDTWTEVLKDLHFYPDLHGSHPWLSFLHHQRPDDTYQATVLP
jgi:hypothetical protein